jgi:hypothetical protein
MRGKEQTRSKYAIRKKKAAPRIIAAPSEEDLRPSDEAKEEIQRLLDWEERSKQRDWVVGHPCR